ncbi:ATP-grasp domain-containing protein [Thalassospiraceae bacterium LMO-SO8]|nr:ATP-grasp domain-containing protein [Alphaproteobacteria bacterium LMO-S08]WND76704.1 ATP-grasp domain-containing protein [Thalassospiraceae bacterium LMO-SO8]
METAPLLTAPEGTQTYGEPIYLKAQALRDVDFSSGKIQKTIEIVTVPKPADVTQNQKNVGIVLDGKIIQGILSDYYQSVRITEINSHDDLERLVSRNPDLVFSGVKYFDFFGKTLWLNDYLDTFGIPYIASGRKALDRESDKSRAKCIVQEAGIATALHFTTLPGEHPTAESIPIAFPLFVKPITGGDSRGVDANSVVSCFTDFAEKVSEIHRVQNARSLAESYLSGKEYSVGILEDAATGILTAMPIEIIVEENENGNRILDYEIKKNDGEKVLAVSDPGVHEQLSELAKAAFRALGGKSFGRIDIMMNHDQVPHFVEANLMPGLRKGYFYRACSLNLDLSYEQMILRIADNGLSRG